MIYHKRSDASKDNRLKHPVVAVLGGAAVGNKIELANELLKEADMILIGGGAANTFLKAKGGKTGRSEIDTAKLPLARQTLEQAESCGVRIMLPVDVLAANEISPSVKPSLEGAMALFDDKIALDIGPRTAKLFENQILTAGTVFWSGPMGVSEFSAFAAGTKKVVEAMSEARAETIVCGGNTIKAVEEFGLTEKLDCIFSNNDAALAYLKGRSSAVNEEKCTA